MKSANVSLPRHVANPAAGSSLLKSQASQVYVEARHGNFSKRRANHAIYQHKSDPLIEWLKQILRGPFDLDVMESQIPELLTNVETLVDECRELGEDSRLSRIVGDLPVFFTELKLREAFLIYNKKYRITRRR